MSRCKPKRVIMSSHTPSPNRLAAALRRALRSIRRSTRTMTDKTDPNAPRTGRATRLLADGIHFGEGPRWRDGRLWFSDFHAHAVKSVSLAGDLRIEFEIDDRPSGLGWMPDGSTLIVSMHQRRLLRRTADGTITVHADLSQVAGWHCNDMGVDAAGRAYVGNFGFAMAAAIARH